MKPPDAVKQEFWDAVWGDGRALTPEPHPLRGLVEGIAQRYGLEQGRVLEVGCGGGGLQGIGGDYTGTDISPTAGQYISPPARFVCCSATDLPFPADSFDYVFSIYVLEHIREVGAALAEVRRVCRPGGLVLLKPAWFCRPWNGREWYRKPYRECTRVEWLAKLGVSIRNSVLYRTADLLQWRVRGLASGRRLRSRPLVANYDQPTVIDADAEVWLDPLDVIRWFLARGDECVSHPNLTRRWLRTADAVVVRVRKSEYRSGPRPSGAAT